MLNLLAAPMMTRAVAAEPHPLRVETLPICPSEEKPEPFVGLLIVVVVFVAKEFAEGFLSEWGKSTAAAIQKYFDGLTAPPDYSGSHQTGVRLFRAKAGEADVLNFGCIVVIVGGRPLSADENFDPSMFSAPPFDAGDFQGIARALDLAEPPLLLAELSVVDTPDEKGCDSGTDNSGIAGGFQFAPGTVWLRDRLSEQPSDDGSYDVSIILEMVRRYAVADAENEAAEKIGVAAFSWLDVRPGQKKAGDLGDCSSWYTPPAPLRDPGLQAETPYGPVDLSVRVVQGGDPRTLTGLVSDTIRSAMGQRKQQ